MTMETSAPAAPEQAQSTSEEGSYEGMEASEDGGEPEGELKKEPERYKIKVDGEEVEVTLEELKKSFGLQKALTQKGQSLAQKEREIREQEKSFQNLFSEIKQNPQILFQLADRLGVDPRQLAESYAYEKLKYERMSEAERDAYDTKRERDELKRQWEERQAREKAEEEEKLSHEAAEHINECVSNVLKLSKLPPKPRTVARIAELYQASLNANGKIPDPSSIADKVRRWYQDDVSELLGSQDVEALVESGLLPEHLLKNVGSFYAKKSAKPLPFGTSKEKASSQTQQPRKRQKIGINKFFNSL